MENNQLSVLVLFVYIILLWPHVRSVSIPSEESTGDITSAAQEETEQEDKKLARSSVQGCPQESMENVGDGRMLAKLSSIMNNTSHPLHGTIEELSSSFSGRLSARRSATAADQGDQRPHAVKRFVRSCDTSFDNYCFNNGQCMFLADLNANTCKCELGFRGSRCEQLLLVSKPMGEDQKAFIIVCVILLIIGLAGALYFFCKWYRKNMLPQQQKRQGYMGVQTA